MNKLIKGAVIGGAISLVFWAILLLTLYLLLRGYTHV